MFVKKMMGNARMSSDSNVPRLLTTKQLAEATGIPRWRLFELNAQGKGPRSMRIGKTLRFPEDGVLQWITEQSSQGESGR